MVRDNLAYSHAAFLKRNDDRAEVSERIAARELAKNILRLVRFSMILFFAYRLFAFKSFPLEESHTWLGLPFLPGIGLPFAKYTFLENWAIDWHYLPISILQACWGFYVLGLISNIFSDIDRRPGMHLGSWTLVMVVVLGLIWTAFVPGLWLAWIGICGIGVGLKFAFLGKEVHAYTGRNRYSLIGIYTTMNSLIVTYLGVLKMPYLAWDLPKFGGSLFELGWSFLSLSSRSEFIGVYYVFIPLIYYFVYMYRAHILPDRAVEFIGLYKRVEAAETGEVLPKIWTGA